ncbi:DUF637 domain-containing protein [Providencia sneebia]|uniref:DUF637 domain-containing protein n=1 Tax=Providencia sneebia TaxID=516075 RepID=UPI003AF32F15
MSIRWLNKSLTSQAAIALAENQRNLSKTLNSLGKSDTVISKKSGIGRYSLFSRYLL